MSNIFSRGMEAADLALLETFGEEHEVQGVHVLAVLDEDEYRKRAGGRQNEPAYGVTTGGALLFCKEADLCFRPEAQQLLTIDGEQYIVVACDRGEKLLTITLEENRG